MTITYLLIIVYSLDTGISTSVTRCQLVRRQASAKCKSSKYVIDIIVSTFERLQAMSVRVVNCAPVIYNKRQVQKEY